MHAMGIIISSKERRGGNVSKTIVNSVRCKRRVQSVRIMLNMDTGVLQFYALAHPSCWHCYQIFCVPLLSSYTITHWYEPPVRNTRTVRTCCPPLRPFLPCCWLSLLHSSDESPQLSYEKFKKGRKYRWCFRVPFRFHNEPWPRLN